MVEDCQLKRAITLQKSKNGWGIIKKKAVC